MNREIVYYEEMHTLMYQVVRVGIDEKMLKLMLDEPLNDETTRELIQTYYLCKLDQDIKIKPKAFYGAWNASIKDIKSIYKYEEPILEKLVGHVQKEDLEKNFKLINEKILALSEQEDVDSLIVQKNFLTALGLSNPKLKLK